MTTETQCFFEEPWQGRCNKERISDSLCCEKHSREKCQVCGEQATTRCQASIGMMCGIPLCRYCGAGEMCLHHATGGPLMIIRALLGGGPVPSIFGTHEIYRKEQDKMDAIVQRLRKCKCKRYQNELLGTEEAKDFK